MNYRYHLYVDESGTFNSPGYHLVCPLVLRENHISMDTVIQWWKQSCPEISWEDFHATEAKIQAKSFLTEKLLISFSETFTAFPDTWACYAWHRQDQPDYGYDFYAVLLAESVEMAAHRLISHHSKETPGSPRENLHLYLDVHLACRKTLNLTILKGHIQERITRYIRENSDRFLCGGHGNRMVNCSVDLLSLRIDQSPFLKVSDVFCNMIYGRLNQCNLLNPSVADVITAIPDKKISEAVIRDEASRTLCVGLEQKAVEALKVVVQKEVIEKTQIISVKERRPEETPKARRVLEASVKWPMGASGVLSPELQKLADAICREPESLRLDDFETLTEETERLLREDRNHPARLAVIEVLYRLLDHEEKMQRDPKWIAKREIRLATLFLKANNHLGYFIPDHERIREADQLCDQWKADPSFVEEICSFKTNQAVGYQNAFRFSEAESHLEGIVRFYDSNRNITPFGAPARSRFIGSLFGTYAQALAFSCHCSCFGGGSHERLSNILDEAEYYSELAKEHFDKPGDVEQQETYQAHFALQRRILRRDFDALGKAREILVSNGQPDTVADAFIEGLASGKVKTEAYRLACLLKYHYLAESEPPWLNRLANALLEYHSKVPHAHPVEQILPYVAMLCEGDSGNRIMTVCRGFSFKAPLVRLIYKTLLLQVRYQRGESLSKTDVQEVLDAVPGDILPHWESYGLDRALRVYEGRRPDGRVGPMEVLPFNYA